MAHALNWFEIPVSDMDRASKFYGAILDTNLHVQEPMAGFVMAMLPAEDGIGGAIVSGEDYTPGHDGALIYLNGGDDLKVIQDCVEAAGGKMFMEKSSIGGNGFMALFEDSEGNKVGLHSMT